MQEESDQVSLEVRIEPLTEEDLAAALRVNRVAFGTFNGHPEPERYLHDVDRVRTRWLADPASGWKAVVNGELVGSNFATCWGSVGFFGPLTIRPDMWDRGIGKRLMEPVLDFFRDRGVVHAGLFTVPHSPKHVGLYQSFGFWPRYLCALMTKDIGASDSRRTEGLESKGRWTVYSRLSEAEQREMLAGCRKLTDRLYPGLDLTHEIQAVNRHGFGDTLLLWGERGLRGFAVCHCGEGTEAGAANCYIKFGAVCPGDGRGFDALVSACEEFARQCGLPRLEAGVSLARGPAYRLLRERGFRVYRLGVNMHRPDEPAYHQHEAYVIDDWR